MAPLALVNEAEALMLLELELEVGRCAPAGTLDPVAHLRGAAGEHGVDVRLPCPIN